MLSLSQLNVKAELIAVSPFLLAFQRFLSSFTFFAARFTNQGEALINQRFFFNGKKIKQSRACFIVISGRDSRRSVKPQHDKIKLPKLHQQRQTAAYFLLTIIYQMHHKPTKKEIKKNSRLICHRITKNFDDGSDVQKVVIYFKPQ